MRRESLIVSSIVLAAVIITCRGLLAALAAGGLMSGHDAAAYPMIQMQFHENILSGNWVPIWANRMQFGYGEAFLMFRPPVFSYLAELWFLFTGHVFAAINLACFTIVAAAAWGMVLLGRKLFDKWWLQALLASAYVLSPYFQTDLYVRGAYSELSVFAIYPFLVLELWNYTQTLAKKHFLKAVLCFSMLSMSHSPVFFISVGFLVLWGLMVSRSRKLWLSWIAIAGAGLALSAFYWIPLFTHRGDIKAALFSVGYEAYPGHFRTLTQLLFSKWGYGTELGMSYAAGIFVWIGVFWALVSERFKEQRVLVPFVLSVISIYFIHRLSAFWYEAIPLLQPMSFPWRFLTVLTFTGTVLGSLAFEKLRKEIALTTLALVIALALPRSAPQSHGDSVERFAPVALENGWGFEKPTTTPSSAYSLPRKRAEKPMAVLSGRINGECEKKGATFTACDLLVVQPARIRFHTLDFPGWVVRVDQKKVQKITEPDTGTILVDVPPGKHLVELRLENSSSRLASKIISIITLLAFLAATIPTHAISRFRTLRA